MPPPPYVVLGMIPFLLGNGSTFKLLITQEPDGAIAFRPYTAQPTFSPTSQPSLPSLVTEPPITNETTIVFLESNRTLRALNTNTTLPYRLN